MRKSEDEPSQLAKLGSAVFYAACSICIFFVNKARKKFYFKNILFSKMVLDRKLKRLKLNFVRIMIDFIFTQPLQSVLTIHHFPSANFVGLGQMCAAVLVLGFLRQCGVVSFPRLSSDMPRRIFPLPLFYVANMITGLNSTKDSV